MNEETRKKEVGIPSRIIRKLRKLKPKHAEKWTYRTPAEYWEARYATGIYGGTSGAGSVGLNREWKWALIEQFVEISKANVLDIGCGDLSFWEGHNCSSYTGLDLSPTIIQRNQKTHPDWNFIQGDASEEHEFSGEVVFCLDMLFHIMSDETYFVILKNLAKWTKKWLFIYTWHHRAFAGSPTDGKYQYYRPLLEHAKYLLPLTLVKAEKHTEYGSMYVFQRQ